MADKVAAKKGPAASTSRASPKGEKGGAKAAAPAKAKGKGKGG